MYNTKSTGDYDDIINLPHHASTKHSQMSLHDRAAQFSPFAALTGHNEAIRETARLTDKKIELDEYEKLRLDEKLQWISNNLENDFQITITYFEPDVLKNGGKYVTYSGKVKKIDSFIGAIVMKDSTSIPIESIYEIECEMWDSYLD